MRVRPAPPAEFFQPLRKCAHDIKVSTTARTQESALKGSVDYRFYAQRARSHYDNSTFRFSYYSARRALLTFNKASEYSQRKSDA